MASASKWSVAIRKKLSKIQSENARVRMIAITDKAREQRQILYQSYREDAQTTFEGYYKEALFVAGVMLYWGEGDNKLSNGLIRISNSDPMVLKFFHAFVGRYLPELYPKLKMSLVLYPDLEDVASCEYWSEKVGIPLDRFHEKPVYSRSIEKEDPSLRDRSNLCAKYGI